MSERTMLDDFELIIEDIGGGGKPPFGQDGGDSGDGNRIPGGSYARKYAMAIALAMVAVLMFFMAMVAAFLVLRMTSQKWVEFSIPGLLWVNTIVLLASSATLELARKRLNSADESGFKKLWMLTTFLGIAFVAGQAFAWKELLAAGIHASTTLAAGFFYVFTVAHAAHLLGGICALLFVGLRNFRASLVTRKAAAEVASYYWHFMDVLWVFLLALLYLGK